MSYAILALAVCLAAGDRREVPPELLAKARWVEGRVELPKETPADERAEVVAHAMGLPAFNDHAAAIGPGGRFRSAFAHDALAGRLGIEGFYLFLEEADEPVWKPAAPPSDVVLRPRLGARLSGTIALPDGAPSGARVELALSGRPLKSGGRMLERVLEAPPGGAFEFRGLSCDHAWTLTARADHHRPRVVEGLAFRPGEHARLAEKLERGAAIEGRVTDEAGAPLAGARLTFDCRADPLGPLPRALEDGLASGADGAFRAAGLPEGDVLVRVERPGYLRRSLEVTALARGETRANVSIVLRAGLVLAGRVVDPAGAPVAGARVVVSQAPRGELPSSASVESAADGSFRLAGLSEAPADVQATFARAERRFAVHVRGVDPARGELTLALVERHALRVRVLDDAGRTVLRYTAGLQRAGSAESAPKPLQVDAQSEDGTVVFDDLDAGPWAAYVFGRGIVWDPAREVDVPVPSGEIVFVVRRPAVVSGVVKLADGKPAARALVEAEWERPALFVATRMKESTSVTTSGEGRFELTEVYPGAVTLRAIGEDGRRSAPLEIRLASGEKRGDVIVTLPP